jgi:hypothetical protein
MKRLKIPIYWQKQVGCSQQAANAPGRLSPSWTTPPTAGANPTRTGLGRRDNVEENASSHTVAFSSCVDHTLPESPRASPALRTVDENQKDKNT